MIKISFTAKPVQYFISLFFCLAVYIVTVQARQIQFSIRNELGPAGNIASLTSFIQQCNGFLNRHSAGYDYKILSAVICIVMAVVLLYLIYLNKRLHHENKCNQNLIREVQAKNKTLEESDHFKTGLISMLAHDFRTPLASTIATIDLLNEADSSLEEQEMLYQSIQKEAANALYTFDNVLQWVKKQYSGYQNEKEDLLIHELIQQATSMYQHVIAAKDLELLNMIPNDAIIKADKEVIQFINRNLIDNAVKHSLPGGNIMIRAERQSNEIIISVKDQGNGMTSQQQGKLFTVNKDNKANHASCVKGAGVALAICKEYIDRLNGRIWSESSPEIGTTLYYAIPV